MADWVKEQRLAVRGLGLVVGTAAVAGKPSIGGWLGFGDCPKAEFFFFVGAVREWRAWKGKGKSVWEEEGRNQRAERFKKPIIASLVVIGQFSGRKETIKERGK